MTWYPHSTVATIIHKDGKFLMVEELDEGKAVFNQPAGHLEENETLLEAAIRETLEETAWNVELSHFLGLYCLKSPSNGATYIRHCFIGNALTQEPNLALDDDIIAAHWLTKEQIFSPSFSARSPLVIKCIQDYLEGQRYPLNCIYQQPFT